MAKLLIIDDESNIRLMLRLALEHVGHTVEQAGDGIEGLEKFGQGAAWDLVLLDHRMPGMEGIEVLRELRRRNPHARVVMITAFGTVDLASEAIRAGATDFLRKPFTIEVLREAVEAALSERPHLPHIANAAPQPSLSFERLGINGYRLASLPGLEHHPDQSVTKVFSVQKTEGAGRACRVTLTAAAVAQVRQHAVGSPLPGGDTFWEALCGEALANYLWQNVTLPTGGQLHVEELTTGLRRWVDVVVQTAGAVA